MGQLHTKLALAIDAYDKKTESATLKQRTAAFQNFAEECHKAIFAHQTNLMAAPGIGNKFKAMINNFLEQYFGVAPQFDVRISEFGQNVQFSAKFNDVKRELTPDDDMCCGLCL